MTVYDGFMETPLTSNPNYFPVREAWLAQRPEEILEPGLPVIDSHHHFYERPGWNYLAPDYLADADSGHNVVATVYMQALTHYRSAGPEALKPVGETEYVARIAEAAEGTRTQVAQGIVGHADLRLGAAVRPVLEAHLAAAPERFKGVRHLTAWDADASLMNPLSAATPGLLLDTRYRKGVAQLAPLGLSYDAWLFFPQLPELISLAKAFPQTTVIVNHCGGVVRIGAHAAQRAEGFERWARSMRELAALPNVHVKLGGLGMRINGFGFEQGALPPSSLELAEAWRPWMQTCIEAFGPERCMFESNFPVDKGSYAFATGWNAFKRLTRGFSPAERHALFEGTARRVYRLC
jgi:predicted TIM-barrel fold metal-dependent hydrolase